MAKFRVQKESFKLIPEGTHTFKVTEVEDKYEDFGKVKYTLQTQNGDKIDARFNFVDNNGKVKDVTVFYFSKFARACLNLGANDEPEVDFSDLVGCYVSAEVKHNKYIAKSGDHEGEEMTGANLVDKSYVYAKGFPGATSNQDDDLDDLEDDDLDDFLD